MAEEFTLAPMRRLLKRHGDLKVSEEAGEEMRRIIGDYGSRLARMAVEMALKENRRTVLARDVRAAWRMLEGVEEV
ncbi:MAG: NFYB/HAP3 family transcription factor subunit [Candidatus Bathyarchaeia archaeon]